MAPISKIFISALALLITSPALSAPISTNALSARQLAGEGAAANSILSGTDNGVGYGVENAEDNTADLIRTTKAGSAAPVAARQLDKIANGAANVLNAAGAGTAANAVQTNGDNVDGQLTEDAANDGAQIGSDEETTLEQAGSDVP